jgi:hypothetical protein
MRAVFFALFFFSLCAAGSAQDGSWRTVDSAADLLGSWEGTENLQIPENQEGLIPASFLKLVVKLICTKDDATILLEMDFTQFFTDLTALPQVKETGISKEALWEFVASQFLEMYPGMSIQGYSITYQQVETVETFLNDDSLMINNRRNRLKIVFPVPVNLGLGDAGLPEIVLVKKRGP